jgi:hypothetical protein
MIGVFMVAIMPDGSEYEIVSYIVYTIIYDYYFSYSHFIVKGKFKRMYARLIKDRPGGNCLSTLGHLGSEVERLLEKRDKSFVYFWWYAYAYWSRQAEEWATPRLARARSVFRV